MNNQLNICIEIDNDTIFECNAKINEDSITKSAIEVENKLQKYNADVDQVRSIYEITVEILQNILNYAHDSKYISENKKEATGNFKVSYQTNTNKYYIYSCNLIESNKVNKIKDIVNNLIGLDQKDIRKLLRQSMRNKSNKHEKGAGLGFIMMAKYVSEPIDITFEDVENDIKSFKLKLVV